MSLVTLIFHLLGKPLGNRFVIQLETFFTYCLRELIQKNSWLQLLRPWERTPNNQEMHLPFFPLTLRTVERALWRQETACRSFWIPEPCQGSCSCCTVTERLFLSSLVGRALCDLETGWDLGLQAPQQLSLHWYCAHLFLTLWQMTLLILTVLPLRQAAWLVSPLFILSSHIDA